MFCKFFLFFFTFGVVFTEEKDINLISRYQNQIVEYIKSLDSVVIKINQKVLMNNEVILNSDGFFKIKDKKFLYEYKSENPPTDIIIANAQDGIKLFDRKSNSITYLPEDNNQLKNIFMNKSKESIITLIKKIIPTHDGISVLISSSKEPPIIILFSLDNNKNIKDIKKISISQNIDNVQSMIIILFNEN